MEVPSLPKKKPKRSEAESQRERLSLLQIFLDQILESVEFKHSVDLIKFLKEPEAAFKSYSEVNEY